jgi:hypothetical protein
MACLRTLARGAALVVALLGAGCGQDVAQTAVYVGAPPGETLDCTPPSEPPELPDEPELGGGRSVEEWELAPIGDYDLGQGPGVTLASLDGFRLFVNGHLLATGTASLTPTFVPLTLLPGDNALVVVVTAVARRPALLLALDELARAYVTGGAITLPDGSSTGFKVSTEPGGDFLLPDFDDSAWAEALDRGSPDENPGCAPGPGFSGSRCASPRPASRQARPAAGTPRPRS